MRNFHKISLIILLLANPMVAATQESTASGMKQKDPGHQLFAGTGFGSNLIYYGTSISNDQPYFSGQLLYSWKGRLWAGAGAYHLADQKPFVSFLDLSAGYNHVFSKMLDGGLVISRYQSTQNTDTILVGNSTFLGVKLGVDFKYLYTTITPGWLWDKERDFFLLWNNSYFILTPEFGKRDSYLTFNPTISFMFGSYAYLGYYYQYYRLRRDSGPRGGRNAPGFGGTQVPVTEVVLMNEDFRLLDLQFSLPVAFYSGKLTFEAEPAYFINFIDDETGTKKGSLFFTIGVYFNIF